MRNVLLSRGVFCVLCIVGIWNLTMGIATGAGPATVTLGEAGNYVILAKTGVSNTGTTGIVGDVGLSPAALSFVTGFSETLDSSNVFATSDFVTGKIYASNMANPTPANLTAAIGDMETAFSDAAGRTLPDFTELGSGNINGMTLTPGLYKWGTGVTIPIAVTLSGSASDVWIFQVAEDLTVGNGAIVTLSGGARPENIFWQVSGQATLGTTSDFKGVILCQTQIVMQTGAVLNGRALAQTAVTLDANAVVDSEIVPGTGFGIMQTCAIESTGAFWAMAWNYETSSNVGEVSASGSATLDYSLRPQIWLGFFVYDYGTASYEEALYVYKESGI